MTPNERLDKLEGDLAQMREDHDISIGGLRRLAFQYFKANQSDHQAFMAEHRAQMAQHLARMKEIEAERETRKAEHLARMAEIQADRGRVDGIEEMTKLLRKLLENNLRRPEKPPETKT